MNLAPIKTHIFGRTGREVTCVGLGGEGVLRTNNRTAEARQVIQAAIAEGITYFDCAHVYADSELYYGSVWQEQSRLRSQIFQASKSASRDKSGARADLDRTLKRMKTDYLDLWQIHDVRTMADLDKIAGPGGALETFIEARSSGLVRHIGVTGHHDPQILSRAVKEWPVDAVMMPVNPVEGALGGFLTTTLPAAIQKGVAVIAMKILGASHYIIPELDITPDRLIRYALSFDIAVAIVGCSSPQEVKILAETGREATPFSEKEISEIEDIFSPHTRRLAFYRGVI